MSIGDLELRVAFWGLGFLLQLALAAWLYVLAPRDIRHRAFALFLVFNGTWDLVYGLRGMPAPFGGDVVLGRFTSYLVVATVASLVVFLGHYPRTRPWARHGLATATIVGLAVGILALRVVRPRLWEPAWEGLAGPPGPLHLVHAMWFPLLVLGSAAILRDLERRPVGSRDASAFLVAAALLVYPVWGVPVFATGEIRALALAALGGAYGFYVGVTTACTLLAAVAGLGLFGYLLWLVSREPDWGKPLARVLGVTFSLLLVAGAFEILAGVSALVVGGLVAYGLARHKLFDLDVKLRWGVSRSTVAAVFLAVFFVVSEGAQEFFGETIGSTYLGILAAGALVFAISPLQRISDLFAERAVPLGTRGSGPEGRDEAYRTALRFALRDRVLSREEELSLAHLADELGLTAKRALELRLEIEDETKKGGGASTLRSRVEDAPHPWARRQP